MGRLEIHLAGRLASDLQADLGSLNRCPGGLELRLADRRPSKYELVLGVRKVLPGAGQLFRGGWPAGLCSGLFCLPECLAGLGDSGRVLGRLALELL
jgi:hypothetical protein